MKFFDFSPYYDSLNFEKVKKTFPDIENRIKTLSQIQNHTYANRNIVALALIHRSALVNWQKDRSGISSNEKFEFLGDSFLNFFVAGYTMSLLPTLTEGDLSKLRAVVVGSKSLAQKSRVLNIGSCLMFGKTEKGVDFGNQDNILADAFEAVTAALLLDAGPEKTMQWLADIFRGELLSFSKNLTYIDAKGALQQWVQSTFGAVPKYSAVVVSEDQRQPMFEVILTIEGREIARACATNKKDASKKVAEKAIKLIESGVLT